MKISEFFEYNNQQVLEENENILEYLEQIFGKSTEIDREGKKEFTFGKVIGLVTDSFLDEKTKRQKVSMLLCDADSKLLLWNGEFSIGDFLIEGGDANWEKMYPLTVTYLKQMCSPEEKTMNYWRMN